MAEKYTADGNYDASIIRNDVDKQVNIIVSDAEAAAAKLEAEGEQEYMRLLAEAYDTQDKKDFYEFSLALDALKASLNGDEKTVILDANSELAKILRAYCVISKDHRGTCPRRSSGAGRLPPQACRRRRSRRTICRGKSAP